MSDDPALTEPTSSIDSAADQAALEAALLVLADFPAGWSEIPLADLTDAQREPQRRNAACVGVKSPRVVDFGGAVAETGDFTNSSGEAVSETAGMASSIGEAEQRMARIAGPDVAECFRGVTRDALQGQLEDPPTPAQAFPEGTTLLDVTVTPLNVSPAGDEVVAYRVTVSLMLDAGTTVDLYLDLVAVRSGRAIAGLEFQSELTPFDIEDAERYIALAAERLSEAS